MCMNLPSGYIIYLHFLYFQYSGSIECIYFSTMQHVPKMEHNHSYIKECTIAYIIEVFLYLISCYKIMTFSSVTFQLVYTI